MLNWLMIAGVTGVVLAALLWPFPTSDQWRVPVQTDLAEGKASYLTELADETPTRVPNVVLIVADDLGRHDISLYGSSPLATPNIDALAAGGVRFNQAYASAAICAPSRAGLLTGRFQNRFGFESQPMTRYPRNWLEYLGFRYLLDTDEMRPRRFATYPDALQMARQGLPTSEVTLAEIYQTLGYRTGIFGKWHLGYSPANHPLQFGFDEQYGFIEAFSLFAAEDDPDVVNHHHDLFWEAHIWDQQRSAYSAITHNGRHIDEQRYLTDAITSEAVTFMQAAVAQEQPFFVYLPFNAPHTPFQARRDDYDAINGARDHNQRVYLAMIRRLDWAVGQLIAELDRLDVRQDTIVIFTSDNGGAAYTEATDNGPLRAGKFSQFDGGLAVPLLLSWPAATDSRVVDEPVVLTDMFATLLGAVGIAPPQDRPLDSVDLLAGSVPAARNFYWRSHQNRALLSAGHKLLINSNTGSRHLYHLKDDPGERDNLVSRQPALAAQLEALADEADANYLAPQWPYVMDYQLTDNGETFSFSL